MSILKRRKKNREEEDYNNIIEENEKGKRNCLFLLCCDKNVPENIKKKLTDFNNNQKSKRLKEITCILTDTTVRKNSQLELGIKANISMIIQGFTSAGKSFLSNVASQNNNKECLWTTLSDNTTIIENDWNHIKDDIKK